MDGEFGTERSCTFDIVQAPKWLRREDLPPEIELDSPFELNGHSFVLTKVQSQPLSICCFGSSNVTAAPCQAGSYYAIKRVGE